MSLGEVVQSNNADYPVGTFVRAFATWQDHYILSGESWGLETVHQQPGTDLHHYMGALGPVGLTAWVGLVAVGEAKAGETVLVSAAGLLLFQANGERPLIKDTTLDIWERSFAVNARGVFLCGRAYLRRREAAPLQHGRIVTFTSVAAQLGGYRSSASYIAAKSAVLGLTKAMARESAHLGVTVNGIAPGLIDTDMLRSTVTSSGALAAAAQAIPLGRIGTVGDVAAAVRFLASEEAGYITGSVIDVNGGYRMQ